ncbi:MAG: hypothetical protein ACE5JH_08655 [Acidobacteriota bacterium]
MSRLLVRAGSLALLGGVLYLAIWDALLGGANYELVRLLLLLGGACLLGGLFARTLGGVAAGLTGRGCPRCGRRVAKGHIYCEEHLAETINEYRDEQRRRGC